MSPIRTRLRAARGGRENAVTLTPGPAGSATARNRDPVRKSVARRSTIFTIELEAGERRQILADRRSTLNIVPQNVAAQSKDNVKARRKTLTLQPLPCVPRPVEDSPVSVPSEEEREDDRPEFAEDRHEHDNSPVSSTTDHSDGSPVSSVGDHSNGTTDGLSPEGERHVHWTDGIRNRAGTTVLPARVPEPRHLPRLQHKVC